MHRYSKQQRGCGQRGLGVGSAGAGGAGLGEEGGGGEAGGGVVREAFEAVEAFVFLLSFLNFPLYSFPWSRFLITCANGDEGG